MEGKTGNSKKLALGRVNVGYKRSSHLFLPSTGIEDGSRCVRCQGPGALRVAVGSLYILCVILTICVAVLAHVAGPSTTNTSLISAEATHLQQAFLSLQQDSNHLAASIKASNAQLSNLTRNHVSILSSNQVFAHEITEVWNALSLLNRTADEYEISAQGLAFTTAHLHEEMQNERQARQTDRELLKVLNDTIVAQANATARLSARADAAESWAWSQWVNASMAMRHNQAAALHLSTMLAEAQLTSAQTFTDVQQQTDTVAEMASQVGKYFIGEELGGATAQLDQLEAQAQQRYATLDARATTHALQLAGIRKNQNSTEQHLQDLVDDLKTTQSTCGQRVASGTEDLAYVNSTILQLQQDSTWIQVRIDELNSKLDMEISNLSAVIDELQKVDSHHDELLLNFTMQKGDPGPKGQQGYQGYPGLPGQKGEKGQKGEYGLRGHNGLQGPKGEAGTPGNKGKQGARGLPGRKGNRGYPGHVGSHGEQGIKGDQGLVGPPGPVGEKGQQGVQGPPGRIGEPGEQGPLGPSGFPGERGPMGKTGVHGPKGLTGPPGLPGPRGLPGRAIAPWAGQTTCPPPHLLAKITCFGGILIIINDLSDALENPLYSSLQTSPHNAEQFHIPTSGRAEALRRISKCFQSTPVLDSPFFLDFSPHQEDTSGRLKKCKYNESETSEIENYDN
uniref:Scavenger receptor class A member 3 n=1 Tax=Eptatretus burgeri TaxID=7764 RepID=A0A8C4WNX8_EPTBU